MSELSILQTLVGAGMTVEAACAMGGNMMAESLMKSNIAQRGMTQLTDDVYTSFVDHGEGGIDFVHDGVGYGLCQWTYPTRKQALLSWARQHGQSVGHEGMQVEFCLHELATDYQSLWAYLCETHDGYVATERICKEYERPAVNNIQTRYEYAADLYAKYSAALSAGASREDDIDREPASYIMGVVRYGDHTPEAKYLKALLQELGYDVCWLGLDACLRDFQQKTGLEVDGVCGEKTWAKIIGG